MIPLSLPAESDARAPFVARIGSFAAVNPSDVSLIAEVNGASLFSGRNGLFSIAGPGAAALEGDIILVEPAGKRARRLIRSGSKHNTLVVTERCDQLCVMCSQPPKKTHADRFDQFTEACLLAPQDGIVCVSGGEPTLYKGALLTMLETVAAARPDLSFQVLTNGQHFEQSDIERLSQPLYRQVRWGVPLYAADPALHDQIVGKLGAHERLLESFVYLLRAGARVELRTVVVAPNVSALVTLAQFIVAYLPFIERWSVMQLENTGFARNRWASLYVDHRSRFAEIGPAVDTAMARGVNVALFNFPRCTLPSAYRVLAPASISDWKQKFAPECGSCREQTACSGFFEWHPQQAMEVFPL